MFKKGDIIRYGIWHGVVLDVYQSTNGSNDALLKVLFAKNVFKMQGPEILPIGESVDTELATPEDLQREIAKYQKMQARALEQLVAA